MNRPEYFEDIHAAAHARWNQLEADKELAGPWHQLFKQVQSPDHVVSELLQNADDAGATWASAKVQDDAFLFTHNGGDFERDHFASLCRFGYSNKRTLHTIGFRGIGFKSVFSLGDRVELLTPSLSVSFERGRFTQPNWMEADPPETRTTVVRVVLSEGRRESLERNFATWRKSPVSLLFFTSIRTLEIGEERVSWASAGPGPVNRSEIVALESDPKARYFHFRSLPEPFPPDALTEIRQERMVGDDEETDFPPCTVEIVTHESGRLFVVLPTEVVTPLPLSANAPFIQDPARLRIKDPAASPTNRWVLGRVGDLAAKAMLGWLANSDLSVSDRAEAYRLLPKAIPQEDSLGNRCASVVEQAFASAIADRPVLLSEDGLLLPANGCVPLPNDLLDVWEPGMAAELLDAAKRPALSRYVTATVRQRLQERALLERFDNEAFLSLLAKTGLPKPSTWRQLLNLWSYVARARGSAPRFGQPIDQRIVPVIGRDHLVDPSEVVRVKERLDVLQESEWEFLRQHLTILDHEWIRYLGGEGDKGASTALSQANDLLEGMGLARPTPLDFVLDQAASGLLKARRTVRDWVTLANIAARTDTEVGDHFRFVTRDGNLRKPDIGLMLDADGSLEELLPEDWRATRLLHEKYDADHGSCTPDEWRAWASSDKSCLAPFVALVATSNPFSSRSAAEVEARRRGCGWFYYKYERHDLELLDRDFHESLWNYWEGVSQQDPAIWSRVLNKIFLHDTRYRDESKAARLMQYSTHGNGNQVTSEPILSNWVMRFCELPCLPDTRGSWRKPGDLLRRTPATEPVLDVEPFVHPSLDIEANRWLLDLLGVGTDASNPDGILSRIRALAEAEQPPVQELDKWYRRLDRLIPGCATGDLIRVRNAFQNEKLIFTEAGYWETAATVSIGPGEGEVPDAPLVRPSVRDLALWSRLGVPERPTVERAIEWLKSLASGQAIPAREAKPLRALLARYPDIVAEQSAHWLDLTGAWRPLKELRYKLTMQGLTEWGHLFPESKRATADLRMLKLDALDSPCFSRMASLALVVEERLGKANLRDSYSEPCPWLTEAGAMLRRVTLEDEEATQRVREGGARLSDIMWWIAEDLELTPYIEGAPAGSTRRADAFWRGSDLYTRKLSEAKLARVVPDEIAKAFEHNRVRYALCYAFGRSVEQVRAFFEENFDLIQDADGGTPTEGRASESASAKDTTQRSFPMSDLPEEGAEEQEPFDGSDSQSVEPEEDGEQGTQSRRSKRRTPKPDIMERFAITKGFRSQSPGRYRHPSGDLIVKGIEHTFPWQLYDAEGTLSRFYLPQDHCLEREPLALEADAWSMIQRRPELYSLVLLNADGRPVELSGHNLLTMSEEGVLSLHPATYRLVYDRNRKRDGA